MSEHLFDEVAGIDGQVRGQIEFTLQDLIDGLLPVFSRKWRLVENHKGQGAFTLGQTWHTMVLHVFPLHLLIQSSYHT